MPRPKTVLTLTITGAILLGAILAWLAYQRRARAAACAATYDSCADSCADGNLLSCSKLAELHSEGWHGTPRDERRAVILLQQACEAGTAYACSRLGRIYWSGRGGLAKNDTLAFTHHQKACDGGDMLGCTLLGVMIGEGWGGATKDDTKAVALHRRACDDGLAHGCANLALSLLYGRGLAADPKEGLALLGATCDKGEPRACLGLGVLHEKGLFEVAKDEKKAIELFQRSCDRSQLYKFGCTELGLAYLNGDGGLTEDSSRATTLFQDACAIGDAAGCYQLGRLLELGTAGLLPNENEAARLYQKACDFADACGCGYLGFMFDRGRGGLKRDGNRAASLYKQGCDLGCGFACDARATTLDENNDPNQKRYITELYSYACKLEFFPACVRWAKRTAEEDPSFRRELPSLYQPMCDKGLQRACVELGELLVTGNAGSPRDITRATQLFRAACNERDPEGCAHLARIEVGLNHLRADSPQVQQLLTVACRHSTRVTEAECIANATRTLTEGEK